MSRRNGERERVCPRKCVGKFKILAILLVLLARNTAVELGGAISDGQEARQETSADPVGAIDFRGRPRLAFGGRRPVTIPDAIEMTSLADPYYLGGRSSAGRVAQFSPDGTKFVVLLSKGNLGSNTVEYSLLLWRTNEILSSPKPDILLVLSSTSNRPAIRFVTWCEDNETILFLGEHPGELQQLYRLNIRTHGLERLTSSSTNVIGYDAPGTKSIAFIAEELRENAEQKVRRFGLPITSQMLTEVLLGHPDEYWADHVRLCIQAAGAMGNVKTLSNRVLLPFPPADARPVLSPNGQYIVLLSNVERIPSDWREYRDPLMEKWAAWKVNSGEYSMLKQYLLFDTRTGERKILLDAPVRLAGGDNSEAAWSADSQSLVITNTYLPLQGAASEEREERRTGPFSVEIKVPSGAITKVSSSNLKLLRWEADTGRLIFEVGRHNEGQAEAATVVFRKCRDSWEKVAGEPGLRKKPEIRLEEGLNSPPEIVAIDPDNHQRKVLLDLNPQFRNLTFAKEEQIRWKATDGHEVEGGLYYPAGFVPGKRYPLVIQTHGFRPDRFQIDGPYTSVFAAQPLAGKGIMVLQAEKPDATEQRNMLATSKEVAWKMSAYDGAIDYLDKQGLIDPTRVGIMGFSRTCWHVKYTLTHSQHRYAAAAISDGFDVGYFGYVVMANRSYPNNEMDQIMGGPPTGEGLQSWLRESPGFNIDHLPGSTPIRLVATYPLDVLMEWEWFSMMRRLGKPVDMVVFLDGVHLLKKPSNRMISQDGNVDWFDFWLNGHQDSDPTKVDQYERWNKLREEIGIENHR